MKPCIDIPAGSTFPFPFDTYDSSGASVTISGLAVTDIEIYSPLVGGVTQRASDNGYALLDTDGIDYDGTTGLHGFSIDFNDNSDAGFYAAGRVYWINVNAITVNSQTVRFTYLVRLVAAENTAGTRVVDVGRFGGTTVTARDIGASVLLSSGTGTGQVKLSSGYVAPNWGDVGNPTTTLNLSGTTIKTATDVEADTSVIETRVLLALPAVADGAIGGLPVLLDVGSVAMLPCNVLGWASDPDAVTVQAFGLTSLPVVGIGNDGLDQFGLAASAVTKIQDGLPIVIRSNTATAGGASTITLDSGATALNDYYVGTIIHLTGGTGRGQSRRIVSYVGATLVATVSPAWVTQPVNGTTFSILPDSNLTPTEVSSVQSGLATQASVNTIDDFLDTEIASILAAVDTEIAAIKLKTDQLTFTVANRVDATASVSLTPDDIEDIAEGVAGGVFEQQVPANYSQGTAGYALGRIGTGRITTVSVVAQSGDATVVQGDSYRTDQGRALTWTDVSAVWPTLTEASIELEVGDGILTVGGYVVTATGANKQVGVQLMSSQTEDLEAGVYPFNVVARFPGTGSGEDGYDRVTLLSGTMTVVDREDE